ncbi:ANTAR domain-containing protein [Cellulomonas sp. NS3]|uniref:ANTAR domain-containing protein n=1 Tax=Cellulomonas sp. NS3 TaxID=2973977 RepID=UPI002161B964|nr:ANTAR domain-containing protein [Cellulomonas sp. NS3]
MPVPNQDLPRRALDDAYRGPAALTELDDTELAAGFLMGTLRVSPDEARQVLRMGALRRGVTLARTVLNPFHPLTVRTVCSTAPLSTCAQRSFKDTEQTRRSPRAIGAHARP